MEPTEQRCGEAQATEGIRGGLAETLARAAGYPLTAYQRAFLLDPSPLRAVLKARQTGFSWVFALEALCEAVSEGAFSIFMSLNREEADEKIRYARDLYEALPEDRKPRLLRGGRNELAFAGGGRLLSFPCRSPRGKARANVYLDEMAFYPRSEALYTGALPVVSHGGRVTLASTPCGDRGMFWKLVAGDGTARAYSQLRVPWWSAPWFCHNVALAEASADAMTTEERVRRFGTPVLARLWAAMDSAAFQQEYELRFLDEADAFIPWSEIDPCVTDAPVCATWADVAALRGAAFAGLDVGRVRDATALVVLSAEGEAFRVAAVRTMFRAPYDEQEEAVARAMAEARIHRLCMDATGLGGHLGERLCRRFPARVQPVTFTAPLKETLAHEVKWALQAGRLVLPRRPDLLEQIHAIRRTVTSGAHVRFDAPADEHGHADQFWALALALYAARHAGAGVRALRLTG